MIQAMYNGITGLQAHKTEMDVISDNIANVNTVGFKSSRVVFRDMLSQTIRGASAPTPGGIGGTNAMQIGLGTSVGTIDVNLMQGSLLPTGKPTDIAIEGNGYLILGDGVARSYTRDGSLQLDADGSLISASSGMKVLGWMADQSTGVIDDTAPLTAGSAINIPVGKLSIARATENIAFRGNLDGSAEPGAVCTTTMNVYDSLGVAHKVDFEFTKTAVDGEWTWQATSADAAGGTLAGSGTLQFNSAGQVMNGSAQLSLTLDNPNGATSPLKANISFDPVTQLAGSEAPVSVTSQDGLPFGVLQSFLIGRDGTISGRFSNGLSQNLARIALAQFSNPAGLIKPGGNILLESPNSGIPQVGIPTDGGLGGIAPGYLESSNVDLPTEFANMIVAQRGFQANSRIITTSDEMLQELVSLKR